MQRFEFNKFYSLIEFFSFKTGDSIRSFFSNYFRYMITVTRDSSREPERYIDPAMIGILAGMALMFIIICVVLRLFSRLVSLTYFYGKLSALLTF